MNPTGLTIEQKATNYDTVQHINQVRYFMNRIIMQLMFRGAEHDRSKLGEPEIALFVKYTPELAKTQYNSPEYLEALRGLKPALDHHYGNNRHHPEHFKNGIADMNIVDLVEMLCDWKAATLRQRDGNLRKSIQINSDRFQLSPQLVQILENSMDIFDLSKNRSNKCLLL